MSMAHLRRMARTMIIMPKKETSRKGINYYQNKYAEEVPQSK